MTKRQVALRLPEDIYRLDKSDNLALATMGQGFEVNFWRCLLVDDYMQTTGATLTEVMVTALATYFHAEDKLPLVERVSRLERRLAALEGRI